MTSFAIIASLKPKSQGKLRKIKEKACILAKQCYSGSTS
jgi:hypothetical protein